MADHRLAYVTSGVSGVAALVRGYIARRRVAGIRKAKEQAAQSDTKQAYLRHRMAEVSAASRIVASCLIANTATRRRERARKLSAAVAMVSGREGGGGMRGGRQHYRRRGGCTHDSRCNFDCCVDPQLCHAVGEAGQRGSRQHISLLRPCENMRNVACIALKELAGACFVFVLKRLLAEQGLQRRGKKRDSLTADALTDCLLPTATPYQTSEHAQYCAEYHSSVC